MLLLSSPEATDTLHSPLLLLLSIANLQSLGIFTLVLMGACFSFLFRFCKVLVVVVMISRAVLAICPSPLPRFSLNGREERASRRLGAAYR